jgi:hypothetical protein
MLLMEVRVGTPGREWSGRGAETGGVDAVRGGGDVLFMRVTHGGERVRVG